MALHPKAVRGEAAGADFGGHALAKGSISAGTVVVTTGDEPISGTAHGNNPPDSLVDVTFSIEDAGADFPESTVFTVTQITATGLGATLANEVVQIPGQGFSIVPTVVPAANTVYAFTYA